MGFLLDFRAQGGYASIHAPVIDHDLVPPYAIQNLVAGEGAPGMFGKELEQTKLFGGEDDLESVAEDFVVSAVELAFAKFNQG